MAPVFPMQVLATPSLLDRTVSYFRQAWVDLTQRLDAADVGGGAQQQAREQGDEDPQHVAGMW